MQGFVFRLVPPRPTFAFDMTDDERALMGEHAAYWAELTAAGRTVAYGPVNDPVGSYGLAVVLAEDLAAAEALRDADPAVRSPHGLRAEIAPMIMLVTPTARYG
jgi:uncharacterized protein YciI